MTFKQTAMLTALSALLLPAAYALTTPAAPASVNTNAEKAAWEALMSPEGEYANYAAYDAVIQKFGQLEPYVSVARAEQNHIQALSRQLQRYGVAVPANPYLGQIPAPATLKAAAQLEADAEVANAAMYDKLMSMANGDAQLQRVFTNLQRASRDMHLVLFNKAAAGNGTLSAAEMTNLHMGMNQMGMGNRQGQGYGQGMGQGMGQQQGRGMGMQGNRQGQGMQNQSMQGQGMNMADCPMHNGQQGQGQGKGGWRK